MSEGKVVSKVNRPAGASDIGAELGIFLLFLLLTVVAAWPVLTRLDWVIVGQDSDVPLNLWADWWTRKALTNPDLSLWQTPYIFFPYNTPDGVNLTFHSFSHLNTVVSSSLRPILGTIPAYNITILLNYVLSGFAMYQLGRYLTGSRAAGILAGIVFAFNSHNQYQSAHPVLLSVWCIPWATRYFWQAWATNSRRHAVITALFLFLAAATSTLLFIMLGGWLACLVLYFWRRDGQLRLKVSALSAGLGLLLSLPLLWPLLRAFLFGRDNSFVIDASATLYITDIISPLFPHWFIWLVRGLYLGIVPLLLLIIARYRWSQARLWYGLTLGAYLLTIGPDPIFLGRQLDVTLPWSLPVVPLLRNPYRLNVLLSLGLAMLVAHGWLVMAHANFKRQRAQVVAVLALGALIFGEYTAPVFPLSVIEVSPFYTEYLATAPGDGALVDIPINRSLGKRYMYFQTYHERPIVGGHISRRPDVIFDFIRANPLLRAAATDLAPAPLPDDAGPALAELRAHNVAYIVIHKEEVAAALPAWQRALARAPIYEDEWVIVYGTD